jgi:hypothetical protein
MFGLKPVVSRPLVYGRAFSRLEQPSVTTLFQSPL